jgi:hypothetical protein
VIVVALSDKQMKAVGLLHTSGPGTERDWPYRKIAEAVGITRRQLQTWRKNPEFQEALRKLPQDQVKNALFEKAVVKGDTQAMKLWLERYGDPPEAKDSLEELLNVTPEEHEEIRWKLYDFMTEEIKAGRMKRPEHLKQR